MFDGGEIIIVRNIVFNNEYADHASITGRPCIVLSDYNDKLTLLPMSSSEARENSNTVIVTKKQIVCNNTNFRKLPIAYVNLNYMFQKDFINYKVWAFLTDKRYYRLLNEMEEKRLEKNPRVSEYYKEIYQDLDYQKSELKRILKEKRY